jgi:excinuclease UvrABC nuclease subunit
MVEFAHRLQFERASRIKRHIELLEGALEPQVVEREVRFDQDVLHFASDTVLVLHVHSGILCGCSLSDLAGSSADAFLLERYTIACPAELIVNQASDPRTVEQRLTEASGHQVRIKVTREGRGLADRLMTLAALNHANRARHNAS